MNIANLAFFDREGQAYNFVQDTNGIWTGGDYFQPVSIALYDVANMFVLEKLDDGTYSFPSLEPGSKLTVRWASSKGSAEWFLFTVALENQNDPTTNYLTRHESLEINYSDFNLTTGQNLKLSYPLQINIGFAPTSESKFTRNLILEYTNSSGTTQIANITFYGEGEDEEERFKIWLANFGIKFNKTDALLLANYDIKESLPDWKEINQARKQILVNRDQIYPYVGTYKGLINLIGILGYQDILRVKEYWKDTDTKSPYFGKYTMIDVTDIMSETTLEQLDLPNYNSQIKNGGKFVKTSFIALAYEFSIATNDYDQYGMPIVEKTTQFGTDEIFYKLNQLAVKLKNEILPINVIIKDIIGEFIYFQRLNLRNWSNPMLIGSLDLYETYTVNINSPNIKSQELLIRDIKTLYPPTGSSEFPFIVYNTGTTEPYSNNQKYLGDGAQALINSINSYYQNILNYEFGYTPGANPIWVGDEGDNRVGCPVVLEAYIPDFTLGQLTSGRFNDFENTHYTLGNIKYRSGYEIEWKISGPRGYSFSQRGVLSSLVQIPHIFPYPGDYTVLAKIYDLNGASSLAYKTITVNSDTPTLETFVRLQDKRSYTFKDLKNITIGDLGGSPLYLPFANVAQNGGNSILATHYFDYYTYMNNFGVGGDQSQVKIWTDPIGFENITKSENSQAKQWGTGSGYKGQMTLGDISTAQISDLLMNRLSEFTYFPSVNNGFYIDLNILSGRLVTINFSAYSDAGYAVPSYSNIQNLVDQLNSETNSQISAFSYNIINGKIHAQAKTIDPVLNRIITLTDENQLSYILYTFCYPSRAYSHNLIDNLNSQLSQIGLAIDEDLLFLDAPFFDILKKTSELVYSNSIVDPTGSSVSFLLTRPQAFVNSGYSNLIVASSISSPDVYVTGTINWSTTNSVLTLDVTDYNSSADYSTINDWEFSYASNYQLENIPGAPASDPMYWVNQGFITYSDQESQDYTVTGFIPSNYGQGAFTLNNTKMGLDGLVVPLHHPVFIAISNIDSKYECDWTLYAYDQVIARILSNSYFIWRFDTPSDYRLTVKVTDGQGTVFNLSTSINISDAKTTDDYQKYTETVLNKRKLSLQSVL